MATKSKAWKLRESLREKGQFWTPEWVAQPMAEYVLSQQSDEIFDPAVGAGAFFLAAKRIAKKTGIKIGLSGREIDKSALKSAMDNGLTKCDLRNVILRDFILAPPRSKYKAIIANPPYVRHHRIPFKMKAELKAFGLVTTGKIFDGRAGLQLYFFIRCLERLEINGRLAFIVSADICEGVYAHKLWDWVKRNYCLDAVITFDESATPFPALDTNPIIIFIRNSNPQNEIGWARCIKPSKIALSRWIKSGFTRNDIEGIYTERRSLEEAVGTGLSRPINLDGNTKFRLGDFAKVMRGIVTGENSFFFLTKDRVKELGIPEEYWLKAVGRTRDIPGNELTNEVLRKLENTGRPTMLLSIGKTRYDDMPISLQKYLKYGEELGLDKKKLISTRSPWYRLETRKVPHFLFSYLGRRNSRFIINKAGIVPLTGFHCIYARNEIPSFIEKLRRVLNNPKTISNLKWVGKSYGGGAIKVEPRALEKLPLPDDVVKKVGLDKERITEGNVPHQPMLPWISK